jgi:alpha-tubulin suppressor-like RCC1 family protein
MFVTGRRLCRTAAALGMLFSLCWGGGVADAQPGLRVWGDNTYGQLGLTDLQDRGAPTPLTNLTGVIQVVSGRYHTLALKSDGTIWGWGLNNFGQLGDGTDDDRATPALVAGLSNVVAIAAGLDHNLALKSDGTVWSWGQNYNGQIGDDTAANVRLAPVQVHNLSGVTTIACGGYHSFALKSDGTLWAWGWNVEGQLGTGSNAQRNVPTRVVGPNNVGYLTDVAAIAGGHYHGLALKSDGTVWAWGWNSDGQLGNGDYFGGGAPIQMVGVGGVGMLTDVVAISGGGFHSLALKSDGTVVACGGNFYGQLGDDTYDSQLAPVVVASLSNVKAIVAGGYHNLALTNDGTVYTWGHNTDGQLGDGASDDRTLPNAISNLTDTWFITAGESHSIALNAAPVTVSGVITLESMFTNAYDQDVTAEFTPIQGGAGFIEVLSVGPDGAFQLDNVPGKVYRVRLKGTKWLARTITLDATVGDVADVSATLLAGDGNNDNAVDVSDLDLFIESFDTCEGDSGYSSSADFNCDGCADVLDLDILIRNFNETGDD